LFTIATASPRHNKTKGYEYDERARGEYDERETKLWAGNEILRESERRPFAVLLERTRRADAPGTRKVVFPGRGLHYASPTGPWPPGSEPLCPRCVVIPEAILRCPVQK
jgi:hypothetical protein